MIVSLTATLCTDRMRVRLLCSSGTRSSILGHLLLLLCCTTLLAAGPLFHSVLRRKSPHSQGVPVFILHGLFGSTKNLQSWAKVLHKTLDGDRDIICVDMPNHGRSSILGELSMDYETMAKDVLETASFLKVQRFHIIGHSMGGKVAASSALLSSLPASQLDVVSLSILDISPVYYTEVEFNSVLSVLDLLVSIDDHVKSATSKAEVEKLFGESVEPDIRAFLMSSLQRDYDNASFRWRFNIRALATSKHKLLEFENPVGAPYNGPVFLLKGAESDFVKTKHIDVIKTHFPRFSFSREGAAGHFLHVEKPAETCSKIARFLLHSESV